jgi:hypothetical protein
MKTDKERDIKQFAFSQYPNSLVQKAKRYDEDVKYLLDTLHDERRRHATCEEEMMVHDPGEISKVMQLQLLEDIIKKINAHYNEPFYRYEKLEAFNSYCQINLVECQDGYDKQLLGSILQLMIKHFNRPSAC